MLQSNVKHEQTEEMIFRTEDTKQFHPALLISCNKAKACSSPAESAHAMPNLPNL